MRIWRHRIGHALGQPESRAFDEELPANGIDPLPSSAYLRLDTEFGSDRSAISAIKYRCRDILSSSKPWLGFRKSFL